jgi:hypothetical protein
MVILRGRMVVRVNGRVGDLAVSWAWLRGGGSDI